MDLTMIAIGIYIVAVILIVVVLNLIQNFRTKEYKKVLDKLEVEKNIIDSTPISSEISKIKAFLKNDKFDNNLAEWENRFKDIRNNEIPKITDMLLEADYTLKQQDYKSTMYKIAKLEMEIYKVKTSTDALLDEIKEVTTSEERNRAIVTKFKSTYRDLLQKFTDNRSEYGVVSDSIDLQFENIAKRFEAFEILMENNDYNEVTKVIKSIDDMLKHMSIVIEEVPSIVLMATNVIPNKIEEVTNTCEIMTQRGYPLDYLNIEYNVEEANKKISDIMDRAKVLNLEDSLFELKVLLDYFDSIFNDFEKEKNDRKSFDEINDKFKVKLDKVNNIIADVFSELSELKNVYNMSDEDIDNLSGLKERLSKINDDYNLLQTHEGTNLAYSKLTKEIEVLSYNLNDIEETISTTLDSLGSMKEDELRARQQLEEVKSILRESKFRMKDYKFPVVPKYYYTELKEASSAIKEIIIELDKKPITIDVLNTRVDTARDLVLKLYTSTKELLRIAKFAEMAIVYGNRYRVTDDMNKVLTYSEILFYKGEYQKSLELSINSIEKIEPGIYQKLLNYYEG